MASEKEIRNALRKELKKEAGVTIRSDARMNDLRKTKVRFYNMDLNTSVLTLQVLKGGRPIKFSQYNTYSFLYLETKDGQTSELLDMEYKDSHNGIVTVTLPNEFLKNATGQTVSAQLYISTNKKNATPSEKSDTVTLNQFTFFVKDALINKIDGEIKTNTLRMFYELNEEVKDKVNQMEKDIGEIGKLKDDLETTAREAIEDISNVLSNAKQEMKNEKDNAISDIEDKGREYLDNVKKERDGVQADIESFNTNFNERINNYEDNLNEVYTQYEDKLKEIDAVTHSEAENWQQYQLTENDGNRKYLTKGSFSNVNDLKAGFYETVAKEDAESQNLPKEANNAFIELDITTNATGKRKQIYMLRNYDKRLFVKTIHTDDDDKGWTEITNQSPTISNWQDIKIKNGYEKSEIPDFDPSYCVVEYENSKEVFVRFGFKKLTQPKNIVGEIPSELVPYKIYRNGTTTIAKIPPKIVIPTNGNIEIHQYTSDKYIDTDYVIYQGSWIINKED